MRLLGVHDSKAVPAGHRIELEPKIKQMAASVAVVKIDAPLIASRNLNTLELMAMAETINSLPGCTMYVDACEPNAKKFEAKLARLVTHGTMVIAEHKADVNHAGASAASIIAKVERDRTLETVRQKALDLGYPDMGSGYPADQRTIQFLRVYARSGSDSLDDQIRKNWYTWQRISKAAAKQHVLMR
jgi:ribonuclease HII